ncbi:tyrosine-type recombinase/integrase [Rhizobium brockwellii]|uniref:tyrosine-type recombinase/integrase n=1 Tax=Rhizobium brockwellii TaxID=3019932 RepID=UPI00293DAA59|nr:integrase arm-type DNA-binding domain-containing protein [Rhizobium brockwellii]MDV4155864.1 integrase arm-type DNA-binding domain-containing protein [Rhizobium brockwellii]
MPKATGQHQEKVLSALKVKQLTTPGRYADGNGLYLIVDPSGAKRWILRITVQGKRRDIGLGGLSLVSLAEAREKALEFRKLARSGGDPLAAKRESKKIYPTFEVAAGAVHAEHKASWKNEKHINQWINTLTQYATPVIGNMRVDRIDTPDILRVLAPIWMTKPETARRVRQRLSTVFDWAKASGYRVGDNPVDGVARGLPKQIDKDAHHEAMPFEEVPAFLKAVKVTNSSLAAKLAFELLILCATRTSETLLAQKSEFDLEAKIWTIPAERMKAKRVHRVPLVGRCVEILKQAIAISGDSKYLFPGRDQAKPLSNMVFLEILRRMEIKVTAHGFRSSFRDWAAETTSFPREIAEMALAHTIENKVEAAYRRGDLLEKRRELMTEWERYLSTMTS